MIVLTLGDGVHGFTLDPEIGEFLLTHPNLAIPADTQEFAVNTSNQRFWEPPVKRYVEECIAGKSGVRGKDFNMRWIASMVAEVHRILMRGGLFMYPSDTKDPSKPGRLRLLYEANPMAWLVEQAGGAASTGRGRILEVAPDRAAPARAGDPGLEERGRAPRALPRRVRPRRGPAVQLAAVQRRARVYRGAGANVRRRRHVGTASHHRDHRLVGRRHDHGDAHLPAHLPPRGHRRPRSSRATRSIATTARRCARRCKRQTDAGNHQLQPLRRRSEPARGTRGAVPRPMARTGTGKVRKYLHDAEEAAPFKQEPGTFTPWDRSADGLRPAVLRGPARRREDR